MGGNLIKQVTSGNYEVKEFLGWDADDNSFYYISNEESPLRQAVYQIDRKGKKTKLSSQTGSQQCTVQYEHEILHESLFKPEYSHCHYSK